MSRVRAAVGDSLRTEASAGRVEQFPGLKCTIAYNRYGGYCVPLSSRHRPAARKVLSNEVFEPDTIEYIASRSGRGDIVHAGTYFGDFLPALSGAVAEGGIVWAFEPNPENFRCASITVQLNELENVVLTQAGLGAKRDRLFVETIGDDGRPLGGGSRIVGREPETGGRATAVDITTIDATVGAERHVAVIQLDVEGHEKEALAGGLETIRRCRPVLILEVLPGSVLLDSTWFAENILALGYRRMRDLHGNVVFECQTDGQPGAEGGGQ